MAQTATLTSEENVGIGVAVVLHLALAAALAWHATRDPLELAPPERIVVSLATDVSLESTSPDPSADPAAAASAEVAEVVETQPEVAPAPVERAVERPVTTPPRRTTDRTPPTPQPTAPPAPPQRTQRDLARELDLAGNSDAEGQTGSPAATFGPAERAALEQAITRQLSRPWRASAPSGVDAELLVSTVAWRLNRDGSLRGVPRCIEQRGITASNQPQAALHCERAIRAIQVAAPFNLPERFYSRWDDLEWNFDRSL